MQIRSKVNFWPDRNVSWTKRYLRSRIDDAHHQIKIVCRPFDYASNGLSFRLWVAEWTLLLFCCVWNSVIHSIWVKRFNHTNLPFPDWIVICPMQILLWIEINPLTMLFPMDDVKRIIIHWKTFDKRAMLLRHASIFLFNATVVDKFLSNRTVINFLWTTEINRAFDKFSLHRAQTGWR